MKGLYPFLFILTACLLSTDTANGLSFHMLTAPVVTVFIICGAIVLLPRKIGPPILLLTGEAIIALCITDCFCQIYFGSPITPQLLTNVVLSNGRESKEFLSAYVGYWVLLKWRIDLLLLLAIMFPVSCFLRQVSLSGWVRKLLMVLLGLSIICELPTAYRFAQLFRSGENLQTTEGLIFRHYHEAMPTPVHRLAYACHVADLSSHTLTAIKRSTYGASVDSCSCTSPHIVLIIGESYNKHHASLYGYRLSTTPLQKRRQAAGELFAFGDVVTPWNITSNVFLEIFSTWEHGATGALTDYPLFPILFRRAGYEVAFFSNQYLLRGFRKGATNQAGNFFLADAELSDSLFSYRNHKSTRYDLGLARQIASYKGQRKEEVPTLDIIHLVGQHFDYVSRYPQKSARFSLHDYPCETLSREARQTVMHYDNATFYDDMVLDSLLTLYEQDEAIAVFVADHGEEVYDDLPMHGRLFQPPTAAQARQEYEVPMWVWCSESYRQRHPDVVSAIQSSAVRPFMTDRLPQLLFSLAGIRSIWTDEGSNVLSADFRAKPRIIGGSADYDSCTARAKRIGHFFNGWLWSRE